MRWVLVRLLVACVLVQPLVAQMPCHVQELQDQTPPEQLPVPEKLTGIGNVHLQVTATPEAQGWFDQGLNLLHDFWDYESARAFEQSIRVDPKCAMCYWGLYQAEAFFHSLAKDYAKDALDKAVALKGGASDKEQRYIEIAASGKGELWRKLAADYPDDEETQLMMATSVDEDESIRLLEALLKTAPNNSAANHLYIHALEATPHPEKALHSAEILPSLAPNSGHMVHMPGHIYFRIGDYAHAEEAFRASMQVDEAYMATQHVSPDNDWNYVHNLMYSIANLMEEGKLSEATELSGKLSGARGKLEGSMYVYLVRDGISRLDPRLPVTLRTANWKQALRLLRVRKANPNHPHLAFLALQLTRFCAGMQAADKGRLVRAHFLSDEFASDLNTASQEKMRPQPRTARKLEVLPDALLSPILKTLSVMSLELRATISARQGEAVEANQLFAKAQQEEDALGYHEPPGYIRPVGETEGAVMVAVKNWVEAKAAYERALQERPHSGFALYGLAVTAEGSGDVAGSATDYRDFLQAWRSADPTLPQLKHANKALRQSRASLDPEAGNSHHA